MTPLSARAKQVTSDLHAATERAFESFDLRTPGGYRAFLRAQAGAFLPLEQAAEQNGVGRWLPDWKAKRRGDLLRADLGALGVADRDLRLREAPSLDPLGIAYVLEGSRHGGRLLAGQVLAGGDPAASAATRFLSHALAAGWWRRFQEVLDAYGEQAGRAEAMLAGAAGAFALFRDSAAAELRTAAGSQA